MSLAKCDICENIFDTDEYPEGCVNPDMEADYPNFLCERCNEDDE